MVSLMRTIGIAPSFFDCGRLMSCMTRKGCLLMASNYSYWWFWLLAWLNDIQLMDYSSCLQYVSLFYVCFLFLISGCFMDFILCLFKTILSIYFWNRDNKLIIIVVIKLIHIADSIHCYHITASQPTHRQAWQWRGLHRGDTIFQSKGLYYQIKK